MVIREYKGKPAVVIRYHRGGSYDDTAIPPAEALSEVIRQLLAAQERLSRT